MDGLGIALIVINSLCSGVSNIIVIPVCRKITKNKSDPKKNYIENIVGVVVAIITFTITMGVATASLFISNSNNIINEIINIACCLVATVISLSINIKYYYKKNKDIISKLETDALDANNKTKSVETDLNDLLISKSQKYKFALNGVFAVSAIIVTSNNEFLLVKRKPKDNESAEDIWLQPGAFYRTNQYALENPPIELLPFYSYLISRMEAETGLKETEYEYMPLSSIFETEEETFTSEYLQYSANYRNNKISPTPFLVQKEKADKEKTSGTTVHIDSFFAFRLKEEATAELLNKLLAKAQNAGSKYTEIKAFSYNYIEKMVKNEVSDKCYNDLYVIIGKFLRIWRTDIFNRNFKNKIRYCTFNPNNNTIWIRLHNNCNLACNFCLMTNRCKNDSNFFIDGSEILTYLKDRKHLDKNDYKIVITGGEPFLVTNLFEILLQIEQGIGSKIRKITVCTNGTIWRSHERQILSLDDDIRRKLSFVINLSGYDNNSYKNITGTDQFGAQIDFVKFLQKNSIAFVANVVMTKELSIHLAEYFNFWETCNIKNIAFSYAIRKGINARKSDGKVLSKAECVKLYESIGNGLYPIENFDNIELMIPSCDECNCQENNNIKSIYLKSDGNYEFISDCLDKNKISEENKGD